MDPQRSKVTTHRYFAGLAEYVFYTRLGVVDPQLVDYIATLLTRFIHCDAVYQVRNPKGRPLREVAEMLREAEARIGPARRKVHRHIGDYTLFWTGVFPEALPRIQGQSRLDRFLNYQEQGKRAYYIASTIDTDEGDAPDATVLKRLSHEFEMCSYGLTELRQEWQRRDPDEAGESAGPLLFD